MSVAVLFALALAQADPAASAAGAPVGAPVTPAGAIPPGGMDASDLPKGAPGDDYGLVSWCRGALTGHMALYTLVKPELKSIERPGEVAEDEKQDHLQMQAGRDYLALYRRAMLAAEKASLHPLHERGVTIQGQGEAIWTVVKAAPPRTRMWSWLMWDLPGRCETAAKRLETRSGLLGAAFRDPSAEAEPAAEGPQAPEAPPAEAAAAGAAETGDAAATKDAGSPQTGSPQSGSPQSGASPSGAPH